MATAETWLQNEVSLQTLGARIAALLGMKTDYDAERGQAIVRVFCVPVVAAYMIPFVIASEHPRGLVAFFCAYSLLYIPVSWVFLYMTLKRPGYYLWRRLFVVSNDYLVMTMAFVLGGSAALPVYTIALWGIVGNGIRFGTRYLIGVAAIALASLGIATALNPEWQAQPFLIITLLLIALLVPTYIFVLLTRLQTAYNLALEANLAKSRFLAQASHDLRQPIHAISLYTALLHDAGLKREARQMVENIDRSLQSVSSLFRSLLDISTLDSGKVMPKPQPVAIGELVREIVRQNAQAAAWAKVTLRVVPSRCYVEADEILLTTMIQNLVSNALKYAPGKPVLIGCRRRDGKMTVAVYDQGEGIADEHLPHVFEEFYRVRNRGDRDVEGVGLGLSIVRRLSPLMGLTVSLRSQQGRGTAALIEGLTIVPAPAVRPRPAGNALPAVTKGLRVLLVEDDEEVLRATAALLQKWGCQVQAEAGLPGSFADCDVLVTDYDLGQKQTGSECIALVRALAGRHVPAIVMTGHDETRVRAEINDPAVPILSKPVRPAELRSTLTTLMLNQEGAAGEDQARP